MIGILPKRIGWSEEDYTNRVAKEYTGTAATIAEYIDYLLKGKAIRIPTGAFRAIKELFDDARRHIIHKHRYVSDMRGFGEYTSIRNILGINQDTSRSEDLKISRKIRNLDSLTQRLLGRNSIPTEERSQYEELLNFYETLMQRGLEAGEVLDFTDDSDDDDPPRTF